MKTVARYYNLQDMVAEKENQASQWLEDQPGETTSDAISRWWHHSVHSEAGTNEMFASADFLSMQKCWKRWGRPPWQGYA